MMFPLPSNVGSYGTREAFDRSRWEDGQWVFWEDRVELVLEGRYDEVTPLHVELSPTYLCNFACPWCSCRSAREEWSDVDVFHRPDATDTTVAPIARLDRIIDELAHARIDIQWVGGEPTMHPAFYAAVRRAADAGLKQCLFTNGSLLHPKRVRALLEAEMVFVRISLDAVTQEVHQRHHGYRKDRGHLVRVLRNLDALIEIKRDMPGCPTQIGLSFVVDEVNFPDLEASVDYLEDLFSRWGEGCIDYIIMRPAYAFLGSEVALSPACEAQMREALSADASLRRRLEQLGIRVVIPSASLNGAGSRPIFRRLGEKCLSCGWFSEIAPSGEMSVCSDRYGSPDYAIGNLANQALSQIWSGERRSRVLDQVEGGGCLRDYCPGNGRGYHLNRLFHQIERFRRAGRMERVRSWVDDLRRHLPVPTHSFFL